MFPNLFKKQKKFNKNLFLFLWITSVFAGFLVVPFTETLIPNLIKKIGGIQQFLLFTFISNLFLYGIATFIGTYLAYRTGFQLPIIEKILDKKAIWKKYKKIIINSIIIGLLTGVLILFIDIFFFSPHIAPFMGVSPSELLTNRPPAWQGLLAAISAGITEEILFRFFGITIVVWLGSFILKKNYKNQPNTTLVWLAIILSATLFGISHLQISAATGNPFSPIIFSRILILNGIAGIIYGYMYWKNGLTSAMLTHFSTNIILHVIVPILFII